MTKAELIFKITEKTGISRVDVLVIVEQTLREIKETVVKGEKVQIRGFGTFSRKERQPKTGQDIKNKKTVKIPARFVPVFKAAKPFSEGVKNCSLADLVDEDDD